MEGNRVADVVGAKVSTICHNFTFQGMFLLFSGPTSIGRSDDTVRGRAEKASQNGERDLTTLTMLFHQIPVHQFFIAPILR